MSFADSELAELMLQSPAVSGDLDVAAMREGTLERARLRPPGPDMHEVRELKIDGLGARLYRPRSDAAPLVVFLHGGGWTIGSLDTHDRACRRLADGSGCAVLAVGYRLSPEHPWPASVDDTVTAVRFVRARRDLRGPVAVAGDSAGGTLATLACLRLRDEDPDALPDLQVLLYPNTDLTGAHPSMREKAVGFGLTADGIRFFNSQWVPDQSMWSDPRVSPLHARDLHGLPPALIVTAEHDPLRDEGEAYAERLSHAGNPVQRRREAGLVHGFVLMDHVSPACAAAVDRIAADVRTRLNGS